MTDEAINLLPSSRRRWATREYAIRLSVLFLGLVTAMTVVAGVLLIPTYAHLDQSIRMEEGRVTSVGSETGVSHAEVIERRKVLMGKVAILAPRAAAVSVSEMVRKILAVTRTGVSLTSLSYATGAASKPSTVLVSGMATSRDALHAYQIALREAPFVETAEVPVSSFAKDADIAFTITVTLAL
ncbi:MAG: hypothetical protein WC030_03840 [Candidatus Paceibacterota bacterium]